MAFLTGAILLVALSGYEHRLVPNPGITTRRSMAQTSVAKELAFVPLAHRCTIPGRRDRLLWACWLISSHSRIPMRCEQHRPRHRVR